MDDTCPEVAIPGRRSPRWSHVYFSVTQASRLTVGQETEDIAEYPNVRTNESGEKEG